VVDELSERYAGLLDGSYDCVDRIVLNGYFCLGHGPGGFREWWRRLCDGSDETLDNTHLMRMAGRFARRARAWASANQVPVVDCKRGERKHRIAEEYLREHPGLGPGVFLVLVARAPAPVWDVKRSERTGRIVNIGRKTAYVNHYSFHVLDPQWGHVTFKMCSHPPFDVQIMLNGHEYTACVATRDGIDFVKDGNCFTAVGDPAGLARSADTLSQTAAVGQLGQVCDRWIYSSCLCFGLDGEEQTRSGFRYAYSVYQTEYSRNLIFSSGADLDRVFTTMVERTRSRLDVPAVRTLFGARCRPRRTRTHPSPRLATAIETPTYDLTTFKVHFGLLTAKAYTKGERVLRLEAIVHNTRGLRVGRVLEKFPTIVERLAAITDQFATTLDCLDVGFLPDGLLDQLPTPSRLGAARLGGVDLNQPRIRTTLKAVLALAAAPHGFSIADLTAKVAAMTGATSYTTRQAAYDLRKLRGKSLVERLGTSRRYQVPPWAARAITALLALREQVIAPILAGVRDRPPTIEPTHVTAVDRDYQALREGM
jgi:hypothetical protein